MAGEVNDFFSALNNPEGMLATAIFNADGGDEKLEPQDPDRRTQAQKDEQEEMENRALVKSAARAAALADAFKAYIEAKFTEYGIEER